MYPDDTLALDVSLGGGVNASTTFGGTAFLKIWEGKKRLKIGAIFHIFRKNIFRPLGGAALPNFYMRYRMTKSY